ncbi:hypothetical protein [Sphingobium yanoikuyae]|uniref:hypothetical protein n=1 Tax=Sphingobium yanoikuyae TaxID=13690 RepID=UPI0028A59841|nr:hypothetical protein [Sphingobium yanoikuyae]
MADPAEVPDDEWVLPIEGDAYPPAPQPPYTAEEIEILFGKDGVLYRGLLGEG